MPLSIGKAAMSYNQWAYDPSKKIPKNTYARNYRDENETSDTGSDASGSIPSTPSSSQVLVENRANIDSPPYVHPHDVHPRNGEGPQPPEVAIDDDDNDSQDSGRENVGSTVNV
ncbi:hypothetical protein QAD02_002792 [Eretmocerus hayati]|uniref:Uncharacterized protein n=1 Tax=Eretmocerus hayati TaxID=131215 RepID=A0ACC2NKV5_9HYME|nr:hypothetical protein QAD02_002792 [Eretmocerus hayati]